MPNITLPDGKVLSFDRAISVAEIAQAIGAGLAKAALAGKVNDRLVDLSYQLETDSSVTIVTQKDLDGVDIIRHSCAHLLAQAVKQLFPEAKVTIGPVIEDGFYYDFDYVRPFNEDDLAVIEQRMHELASEAQEVHRKILSRREAIKLFKSMGEGYKVEIIESIPGDEPLSFYEQGDFIDLCRGPHVPNTNAIKAFKLTRVAGAYWRGNAQNKMLQRIYGTAWGSQKDLEASLFRIAEAEKRDHRLLGKKFHLFHQQEEAPGMVFWHPKGWFIYQALEQKIREILNQHHYHEIKTPQLVDRSLWEKSGHWEKFREHMFTTEIDERHYALKPMNCPCHVQVFNQGIKSYRDLPLRLAEFGSCHRYEPSGALHGLMRVRNFVQDDAHIFCTEDQILGEVVAFNQLLFEVYALFGFEEVIIKLSTRPAQRVGEDAIWDKAEQQLEAALRQLGLTWILAPGEGAFYGPKIEYSCKDLLGRVWQCGTMQVDFSMPKRLGAEYIAEDGSRCTPVMLHRAILGSLERFVGILIEHTAGNFAPWLAPIQAVVLTITDQQKAYALKVVEELKAQGFRVTGDLRNEKIGYKIREHTVQRVPYLLVVGNREAEQGVLSVRTRGGEDLGSLSVQEFSDKLQSDVVQYRHL